VEIGFPEALLTVGLLLLVAASLSGLMHGTVLSISVLSVAAGIVLAEAGAVSVDAADASVIHLIELALVLTLFADGLLVDRELLWLHWSAPVRAIAIAMPVTLVLLAGAALVLLPDLGWQEAFLLAAVLTPTDPVVTSSVVSAPGVPAVVRHTLNLESGLNDGLALPFVLFFLVLAAHSGDRRRGGDAARRRGSGGHGRRSRVHPLSPRGGCTQLHRYCRFA
jgi:sodium/hydrogen antiporter